MLSQEEWYVLKYHKMSVMMKIITRVWLASSKGQTFTVQLSCCQFTASYKHCRSRALFKAVKLVWKTPVRQLLHRGFTAYDRTDEESCKHPVSIWADELVDHSEVTGYDNANRKLHRASRSVFFHSLFWPYMAVEMHTHTNTVETIY